MARHRDDIVVEIIRATGLDAFRYLYHSTGRYGPRKVPGVTLQLVSVATGEDTHVIFNAGLDRVKDGPGGKAGKPLPKGQFRVGKESAFIKFWRRAGLTMPNRLSKFHKHMGNLDDVLLTGRLKNGRLDAGTLAPLTIASDAIRTAILGDRKGTERGQMGDRKGTDRGDKETPQSQTAQGMQPFSTTGDSSYGNKVIRERGYTGPSPHPLRPCTPETHWTPPHPEDQTHDDWLADYDRAVAVRTN
jgi:hypothetical protein